MGALMLLLLSLLLEAGAISCLQKKKERFQPVETKWNKKGENVKLLRALQKTEQQTTPFENA